MTLLKVKQLRGPAAGSLGAVITFDSNYPRWSSDLSTAILVPNGTTSQRPISVTNGFLRFNSDSFGLEFSSNGSWKTVAALDSPIFTGLPTAPTPLDNTNPTRIATTDFVIKALTGVTTGVSSVLGFSGSVNLAQLVSAGIAPINSNVIIVTTGNSYSCSGSEQYIVVKKSSASLTSINLPSSPATGQIVNVKDGSGNSPLYHITVMPSSGLIDGYSNFIIDQPYQSTAFLYNGTEWNIV